MDGWSSNRARCRATTLIETDMIVNRYTTQPPKMPKCKTIDDDGAPCNALALDAGYVKALHRPENEVILLHVPEIFDGDRGSKYCTHSVQYSLAISFVAMSIIELAWTSNYYSFTEVKSSLAPQLSSVLYNDASLAQNSFVLESSFVEFNGKSFIGSFVANANHFIKHLASASFTKGRPRFKLVDYNHIPSTILFRSLIPQCLSKMYALTATRKRMQKKRACLARKPDDDYNRLYVLHQRLWMFDVLVCPLSATERFLLQSLVCRTVFYRTSLLPPLSLHLLLSS